MPAWAKSRFASLRAKPEYQGKEHETMMVRTASRIKFGLAQRIHMSEPVGRRLKDAFLFRPPAAIDLTGRGSLPTWLLGAAL
jgi:hypothetical protein